MKIKNIFFDFDGVLAESVNVKTEAFYKLYLEYGEEVANKVVEHHKAHGGVSRFEKFKIYHRDFLGEKIDDNKVQELANQFSELVVNGVVNALEVPGASNFVLKHHNKIQYWIITGTPTEEMKQILKRREMEDYFVEICGSPTKKPVWVRYLLDKYSLSPKEIIFLGDAMSDYKAAMSSNLHFGLREYDDNKELFSEYAGLRFSDFYELDNKIDLH